MHYPNLSEDFLEFLLNPKKNNRFLNDSTFYQLIFYFNNIPFFKKYIQKRISKKLFRNDLKYLLDNEINIDDKNELSLSKNKNKLLNLFSEIFSIDYLNEGNSFLLEKQKNEEKVIKLEYLIDRIKEQSEYRHFNQFEIVRNKNLIVLFFCSELLYYVETGLFNISLKNDEYMITLNYEKINDFKTYWLTEILEFNTNMVDNIVFKGIASILKKKKSNIPENKIIKLVDYVFDKVFQLQPKFFSQNFLLSEQFIFFRNIILFSSLVECFKINEINRIKIKEIEKLEIFNKEFLDFLIDFLDYEVLKKHSFQFVYIKNSYIYRGDLSFKYGVKKLARTLIDKKSFKLRKNSNKTKDFLGLLGDFFEQNYVYNYLQKDEYKNLDLFGELKPNSKSKIKGYYIDLIIHEKNLGIYYFIQVKFKFDFSPIYLGEKIKFFNSSEFKHWKEQLTNLKINFNDESIRKKLESHKNKNGNNLSNANLNNSYFILLHNLPYLNFLNSDGVFLYEWNLFRNILDGCRINRYDKNGSLIEIQKVIDFPMLHKPNQLVDTYINEREDFKNTFELYEKAYWSFKIDKKRVISKLI